MSTQLILPNGQLQPANLDFTLVDGSSSMRSKWWDTLAAVDEYHAVLRSERVATRAVLSTFNEEVGSIDRDVHIDQWQPLCSEGSISFPGGGTALYDAINAMGRFFRELMPLRAAALIATDGEEEGSRYTNLTQAKSILDWMRAHGWQVTFIGCDFNNQKQAGLLGGNKESAIGVSKANLKLAASALAKKRANHARTGAPMHWTEDEQQRFGGYLAAPK